MSKRLLLQSQKNSTLESIQKSSLNPADFEWSETGLPASLVENQAIVSKITHRPTGYYFIFDARDHYCVRLAPGLRGKITQTEYVEEWEKALLYFKSWISVLETEISSPDLWAEIRRESALLAAPGEVEESNERFDDTERSDVHMRIDEVLNYLTSIKSGDESFHRYARNRLEYLKDASNRLGRKDFKAILVGTLCGLAIQAGMSSSQASDFFRFAGTLFSSVWKHLLN